MAGNRSEHVEQAIFVARMRNFYPNVVVAAIPNGGYRTATEGAKLRAEGVLPGFPDLIVAAARGGKHGLFVEMKSKTGRVSRAQTEVGDLLRKAGYEVVVAFGAEEAFQLAEEYLARDGDAEERWWL